MEFCQEYLEESPTRDLDQVDLSLDQPAAFLGCLGMDNKVLKTLRIENAAWDHYYVSFLAYIDEEIVFRLTDFSDINIFIKNTKHRNKILLLMTASIRDWVDACYRGCTVSILVPIFNEIINLFKAGGFHEVFSSYEKISNPDGTFHLRRHNDHQGTSR